MMIDGKCFVYVTVGKIIFLSDKFCCIMFRSFCNIHIHLDSEKESKFMGSDG